MPHQSILAHLAPLLTNQIENVATDALAHLLLEYPILPEAFRDYISQAGIDLPERLNLKTQARWQDAAIPDLVGLDEEGQYILIVESKFWAPLTPNQPTTYIERLPPDKSAILLFIAPASRLTTLWQELLDRVSPFLANGQGQDATIPQFFIKHLNTHHILALTSWESLLMAFHQKAQQVGDIYASGDIWQLQRLCSRIDEDAFHPLSEDELTSPTKMRIAQFRSLVDDLITRLVDSGIASIAGYKATPRPDSYKRYMSIHGLPDSDWCVEFNDTYRRQFPPTCLWLTVMNTPQLSGLQERLTSLSRRDGKRILIPLKTPVGVEREAVLDSLFSQVVDLAKQLAE
jgi:hypothetical protein